MSRLILTPRRWAALTLALLVLALGGIAALVIVIDPFEVYHKATAFVPPITNGTQSYSNAGIAKNYPYDSVVIGSSMTENFLPSELDALFGGRFVKLCINGGSPFNHRQMMEMAFATHDVKRVLYCIDADALTYFYKQPKFEMPDYLYDFNLANDVRYWFNASVLTNYIPKCLRTWGKTDESLRDTMYTWGDLYPYGKAAALAEAKFDGRQVEQRAAPEPFVFSQQTKLNFEHNYQPFIEGHPDTEFVFFFPPYSAAKWYAFYRGKSLESHLSQCAAITDALLAYPNVRIYDFRARTEWITNLDNYIDDYHYGPWINSEMARDMAAGACRVTDAQEILANNDVLRTLVNTIIEAGCWPEQFVLPDGEK